MPSFEDTLSAFVAKFRLILSYSNVNLNLYVTFNYFFFSCPFAVHRSFRTFVNFQISAPLTLTIPYLPNIFHIFLQISARTRLPSGAGTSPAPMAEDAARNARLRPPAPIAK